MKHSQGEQGQNRGGKRALEPAIQVICLASGGGPSEDSVSGLLVRSGATAWKKNSVLAVDAGMHLAGVIRVLDEYFPNVSAGTSESMPNGQLKRRDTLESTNRDDEGSTSSEEDVTPEPDMTTLSSGPFAGLPFPFESSRANAAHFVRECVSTYLITHPHLDHISGFAMNTAAFHNTTRPKRLAALPSTIQAIKTHIFNNIIWPNLTDEDGGVGFVTFQRLAQGGNIAVGEGSARGYMEVCDGLCVKGMKISHGRCTSAPHSFPARGSDVGLSEASMLTRSNSQSHQETITSPVKSPRSGSISQPPTPHGHNHGTSSASHGEREMVVDSTAYFIREDNTGREVLIFGDVEPDALSLTPRTKQVWVEAAPKIADRSLRAIFIECSYDDSQADNVLFGHLAPRWLIAELAVLAELVKTKRSERRHSRKRKWAGSESNISSAAVSRANTGLSAFGGDATEDTDASAYPTDDEGGAASRPHSKKMMRPAINTAQREREGLASALEQSQKVPPAVSPDDVVELPIPPRDSHAAAPSGMTMPSTSAHPIPDTAHHGPHSSQQQAQAQAQAPPLANVTVIVTHMKDTLKDGPVVGETILRQLKEHEARLKEVDGIGLGCEFVVSKEGGCYWF